MFNKSFSGRPLRFVIPLNTEETVNHVKLPNSLATAEKTGVVHLKPEKLCDQFCELPRFHYDELLGKKYKYFYAVCFCNDVDATGKVRFIMIYL